MFQPTKPHKEEITAGQRRLRMGSRVPTDAVSLAYAYSSPLNPSENVQVTDLSGFILENVTDQNVRDTDLWPNDQGLLTAWGGEAYVGSRNFSLTNEFLNGEPLYYVHELKSPILDTSGNRGYANGGIAVVDARGNALPEGYLYKIVPVQTDEANVYKIRIFTNFQKQPSETIKAVYTAYHEGRILPGYSEQLNPYHAFTKAKAIEDVSLEPGKALAYYQAYGRDMGESMIYVGITPIRDHDWRTPVHFRYRITATATKGAAKAVIVTPWLYDSLYSRNALTEADIEYRNGYKMLGGKFAKEIVAPFGDMTVFEDPEWTVNFSVESNVPEVVIYTQTDGSNHVLAYTDKETATLALPSAFRTQYRAVKYPFRISIQVDGGDVQYLSDEVDILEGHKKVAGPFEGSKITVSLVRPYDPVNVYVKNNEVYVYTEETDIFYVPRFAVQTTSNRQIRLLPPAEKYPNENWYLRVKNGQFTRTNAAAVGFNITHFYSVPEYFKQDFDPEYGMPIRKVIGEKAQMAGDRKVRLRYTPLFIRQNQATGEYNLEIFVNGIKANIKGWLLDDGIVEIDMKLKETDSISASYYYEESAFTYRGYWDEKNQRFWNLDLNPGAGHSCTVMDKDTQEIREVPTFHLINKTVYVYLKPSAKYSENKELVRGSYEPRALYHTFEEINEPNHILLGKIMVRPNSSYENMQIMDTRKRGGGLKEKIREDLIKVIEPESASYWDIGYWDGEPYSENGVVIVRLPVYILKEQGGDFTKDQVEQAVRKHLSFGNLPVIEYIDEPRHLLEVPKGVGGIEHDDAPTEGIAELGVTTEE